MQTELQDTKSQEYAEEFMAAVRADVGTEINDKAVKDLLARLNQQAQ